MNFKTLVLFLFLSTISISGLEASSSFLNKTASTQIRIEAKESNQQKDTSLHNWLRQDRSNNRVNFPTRNGYILLRKEEIISFRINKLHGGLLLQYWNRGAVKTITCHLSLTDALSKLDEFPFLKVSRSAIVNLDQVSEYIGTRRNAHLKMKDGSQVKMSRKVAGAVYDWVGE